MTETKCSERWIASVTELKRSGSNAGNGGEVGFSLAFTELFLGLGGAADWRTGPRLVSVE